MKAVAPPTVTLHAITVRRSSSFASLQSTERSRYSVVAWMNVRCTFPCFQISMGLGRTKLSLGSFKIFVPKPNVFGAYYLIFSGKIGPVSFTFFTKHVCLALFGDFTVRRFESEFALHGVNKTQTANCDRFRPPTFSRHHLMLGRLVYRVAVCSLKIRNLTKAA